MIDKGWTENSPFVHPNHRRKRGLYYAKITNRSEAEKIRAFGEVVFCKWAQVFGLWKIGTAA